MVGERVSSQLAGRMIKEIFESAAQVADLHACLTSSRGDSFRLRLLQALEATLDEAAIEEFRAESGINEYHRHLNQLFALGLVAWREDEGRRLHLRTQLGERAVNALREFERRVGWDDAQTVYAAALGPNSIQLFLRIYGDEREPEWDLLQIRYSPAEIGRLCLFLPRTIEGLSAIDKLNEAELLVYQDDNRIHMQPLKARAFYQYLQKLYQIIAHGVASPGANGEVHASLDV